MCKCVNALFVKYCKYCVWWSIKIFYKKNSFQHLASIKSYFVFPLEIFNQSENTSPEMFPWKLFCSTNFSRRHILKLFIYSRCSFFKKILSITGLFLFIFVVLLTLHGQIQHKFDYTWKKLRRRAWELNQAWQDGRRRRIHRAIAAPHIGSFKRLQVNPISHYPKFN